MTTVLERPLTQRQAEVLGFIKAFHRRHRIGLGVRDICAAFGFASPNGALSHLWPLRRRGLITWTEKRANSIIPVEVADAD